MGAIVVDRFKQDLHEMGVVGDPHLFEGTASICIRDAVTADEYVARVFVPKRLPTQMATRTFLGTALVLFDLVELQAKIVEALVLNVKMVPHVTAHVHSLTFSCSVIFEGPVTASGRVSPSDAHRLVLASTQTIKDNFNIGPRKLKEVLRNRPGLITCVTEAIAKTKSRTKGRLRHILSVVAFATMLLADQEKIFGQRKPDYRSLRVRTTCTATSP